MKIFKTLFLSIILVEVLLFYVQPVVAYAQNTSNNTPITQAGGGAESSIKELLCTPSDTSSNPAAATDDLVNCINKLYRFSIALSSIFAVLMIVVAGYLYMASDGNEESVKKAKDILVSSITGLVILFIAFVLLDAINPELTKLNLGQFSQVKDLGGGASSGPGPAFRGGGGNCSATTSSSSYCNVERMKQCGAWNPESASKVCNFESGGGRNPAVCSGTDKCSDGYSFSCGLFQVNIIAHQQAAWLPAPCKGIFSGGANPKVDCLSRNPTNNICVRYNCRMTGTQSQYEQCRAALGGTGKSIDIACTLYKNRGNWGDWRNTANKCLGGVNVR